MKKRRVLSIRELLADSTIQLAGRGGMGSSMWKHPSTKQKWYFATYSYKGRIWLHGRAHRTSSAAMAQANRIIAKLRYMEAAHAALS